MDQVEELLDTIAAHKLMGVTGASVMFCFFKRRVQPIQQRHKLGFEYTGAEDPSCMCTEELSDEAALLRVKRGPLDVNAVPYVPGLFSARSSPKPVSIRLLLDSIPCCSTNANRKYLTGTHRGVPEVPSTTRHPSTGPPPPQRRRRSQEGSSSRGSAQQRVH
jgi:hypothetical protein